MASHTIRVKAETHVKLKTMAQQTGQSMPDVLEQAVESLRRQRMIEDTNRAYAALRHDAEAWNAALAERAAWYTTLDDALDKN